MISNGEQIVIANGVEICLETFGNRADPALLLIHGAAASMLWWEHELCASIAAQRRFVIRFDHRDTGRSTSYPPGRPGYGLTDMANDAVGLLDALGIAKAHVVGRSMSGAIALILGVDHPQRVASLTFVATTTGDDDLPPMSDAFLAATSGESDVSTPEAAVATILRYIKAFSGTSRFFDEAATRALAEADVARTRNIASAVTNHWVINIDGPVAGGFADIHVPALVVHGSLDPVFPLPHGEALRDAIPGGKLLVLEGAGHEVPRPLWDIFVSSLIGHTSDAEHG